MDQSGWESDSACSHLVGHIETLATPRSIEFQNTQIINVKVREEIEMTKGLSYQQHTVCSLTDSLKNVGERTQMLPHAEDFTADHHPHVAVPLKTEKRNNRMQCDLLKNVLFYSIKSCYLNLSRILIACGI